MNVDGILARHPNALDENGKLIRELHGVTLKEIVETLQRKYDWAVLAKQVPIKCFSQDPSIASSLTFLRRTPWARTKVDRLYIAMRTLEALSVEGG